MTGNGGRKRGVATFLSLVSPPSSSVSGDELEVCGDGGARAVEWVFPLLTLSYLA